MPNKWTDEELRASVVAYIEMLNLQQRGERYSKKDVYRELGKKFNRTPKAFEYRMQNISAVLAEMNEKWIEGLVPAKNVGAGVKARLRELLESERNESAQNRSYKLKLPAMRDWLIGVARDERVVTYPTLKRTFGTDFFSLTHSLRALGRESRENGEPIITSLIVGDNGHCSSGFERDFGVNDDAAERAKVYEYWRSVPTLTEQPPSKTPLEERAKKFAQVEVRPEQVAFRRAVFIACAGMCVISRCAVEVALDAAHRKGRDWRLGHNSAKDGYLLRKDLHALYDADLLTISEDGRVSFDKAVAGHYQLLDGVVIG